MSESTLPRRQFVGLVGGAIAGAAIPNSLMSNAIVPASADGPKAGKVSVLKKGAATIHTYIAPDNSVFVTSHIIETAKSLIIVDAQYLQSFGKELRAYAESLKKPIAQVILSHEHPDHWYGASVFADIPFTSTAAVLKGIQAQLEPTGSFKGNTAQMGPEAPSTPRIPDGKLALGAQTIDGVAFEFEVRTNAESPEELVIKLPEANAVIVQDLLYNGVHFFPGLDRKNWIAALDGLRSLKGYDTLLVGHGMPTSLGQIDHAIEYLTAANDATANAKKAEDISAALVKRYPSYQGAFLLSFWPLFFKAN